MAIFQVPIRPILHVPFFFTLFILFFFSGTGMSQILPKDGSRLNYRIIGFSVPSKEQVTAYKIEIAIGNIISDEEFQKNIIVTQKIAGNRIITEVPSFGAQYTWRATGFSGNEIKTKSPFYHFSTGMIPEVDTALNRFRVISKAKQYKDAYVFLETNKALYDMRGRPVWYLPGVAQTPVDMKLSSSSTITFLAANQPVEVDYNGRVLWQHKIDTNAATLESYHHEFTRMNNGHYMVFGSKQEYWKLPFAKDSIAQNAADSNRFYQAILFATLMEYDEKERVVWSWYSSKYVKESDLVRCLTPDGRFDLDLHGNSFYFDAINGDIYISFRVISRVIKIKYPEGNVLNTYGVNYSPGRSLFMDNDLFCNQHSVRLSKKGLLYLFNNNLCKAPFNPKIIMMQEPAQKQGNLKKIWEYNCTVENSGINKKGKLQFKRGGNVVELPDESLFVSMCDPYSKVFIVNIINIRNFFKKGKISLGKPDFTERDLGFAGKYLFGGQVV